MNNETRTLWISVAAGLFAMFLVYSFLQEQKAEIIKPYGGLMNVVVAAKDIREMETIDDSMIETKEKPQSFVEPGAIRNPDEVVGQVSVAAVKKGEQILQTKLLQPGPQTGISMQVQPTKRAITLPVNEYSGVARLIRPGDRVDIIAAVDVGKGPNQKREVSTILMDVPVLATGVNVVNNIPRVFEVDDSAKSVNQITLTGDSKYASVTIEVSPKEAQDLVYLMATGGANNIYFTLKNPNDRTGQPRLPSSTAEGVTGRPVMDLTPAPLPPPSAPTVAAPAPLKASPRPRKGYRPL
ncbi:MAG: Flp pilus assembly protein CpaB [Bdellovibrio sp.]|nr:MAG: Flp pilus assembly protein CpaB [Bdellovibrio sp.]